MTTTTNQVKPPNAPTPMQATSASYEPAQGNAQGYTSQAANASGYQGAQGDAANYTADQREVGANSTVKGQMEGLLSEGSKYLDIARSNAAMTANKRGFLNSTMAAGAGERAAIESALPIASQDASTYNNQSLTNQNASNQQRQYNAGNDQQMTLANMDSTNTADRFTAGQEQQNSQFNAANENEASQFTAQQKNAMEQFNAASTNEAGQFNATADMNTSQFNTTQSNNMLQNQWSQLTSQAHEQVMKNLDTESRQKLIDFEKKWDRLIEQDRAANTAYSMAMQSLGTAMSNGQLSTEQQKYAAEQISGQLESYMALLSKLRS